MFVLYLECHNLTVDCPGAVRDVVPKRLPVVFVLAVVMGAYGELGTSWSLLDQDSELLIHESSGRMN